MKLQILTSVWGQHHVDLFINTTLRSLTFLNNQEALRQTEAVWNIFTNEESMYELERAVTHHHPSVTLKLRSKKDLRAYIDPVQASVIWQIEECLKTDSRLLIAPPDTIFGDNSVHNLLTIGREKGSVVVVPHPRVLPTFVTEFNQNLDKYQPNHMLVSLAWKHLHRSWSEAKRGCVNQSSYIGGVEWDYLSHNLYSVTHRLPSPYLIDFTEEDLQYFKSAISFGHFDHMWPGDILIPRGRQRFVGSSDAVFICEVTDADKNVPPVIDNQPSEGFWRNHVHNQHNAQIRCIFRGEP